MEATAVAHPNIALIKYWGKSDVASNLPAVGSISITLDSLTTTTRVLFDDRLADDEFELNGRPAPERLARVRACLDLFRRRLGTTPSARVESQNNFPTAAGLASSASGFAALVVAIDRALGSGLDRATLAELARQCSGSAARSIFGGFVELSLDREARRTSVRQILGGEDWPMRVVIAVTSAEEKTVGSTEGMRHIEQSSPYYGAWVATSDSDLSHARSAIMQHDFDSLADISEQSCLKMHAVALAARPGLLYWNGTTVECVHRIRSLRGEGTSVFFTIDAGPQVKAICLPEHAPRVEAALGEVPGVVKVMSCALGEGARVIGD